MKKSDLENANIIRKYFADLTKLSPEQMVLCYGIGVNLLQFLVYEYGFEYRKIHFVIGPEEYLGGLLSDRYPTTVVEAAQLVKVVVRKRPTAVLLSHVSWLGTVYPVREIFGEIRQTLKHRCPLLIADCAHSGAVSFTDLTSLGADIVCLDTGKWVMKGRWGWWSSSACLLWFSGDYFATARKVFAPYLLALAEQIHRADGEREYIVPPELIRTTASKLPDKLTLTQRLSQNLKLARELERLLGIERGNSSLLCVRKEEVRHVSLLSKLERHGLVWRLENGMIRIRCCSDLFALK